MEESVAWRLWYLPIIIMAIFSILSLVILRASGVLSPDPLVPTRIVVALKWGLVASFFLQMPLAWRNHRRWYLTEASFRNLPNPGSAQLSEALRALNKEDLIRNVIRQRIKTRCAYILGNVMGEICMLIGLYVIQKSDWLLAAILIYSAVTAVVFRPKYPNVPVLVSQKS